jgi:predicted nucleic acid-binding protein
LKLLADTSALLALVVQAEPNHRRAVRFIKQNPHARFVVTDLILGELVTRVRALRGASKAVEIAEDLLGSSRHEFVFVDIDLLRGAIARMTQFSDKRLSLTDCASFELMHRLGMSTAFTFDRDFRDCGFEMVPQD